MTHATELDLGPLTWVKSEIDLALARTAEALEGAAGAEDGAARVQFAQTHLHQARGALSIVGLDGLTQFASALDHMLASMSRGERPIDNHRVELARRAVAAIGNYLEELVHGASDQALRLAPLYAELAAARGAAAVSPAELFFPDLTRRPPRRASAPTLTEVECKRGIRVVRSHFERALLGWLRSPQSPEHLARMRQAVAGLDTLPISPQQRALWWASLAFLDGLATTDGGANPEARQLCAQLNLQMRRLLAGAPAVPDRLMRELLYRVATTPAVTEQQHTVRSTWQLDALLPEPGASVSDVPLVPLLQALRSALNVGKESWNDFCGGTAAALPRFEKELAEIGSHGRKLGRPAFDRLISSITEFVQWLRKDPLRINETIAIEVATALLLGEAALDHGVPAASFANQVADTSARLAALMRGETIQAAEASPTVEVARRAQEREAVGQLAREIRSSLGHIEQVLDDYFRDQTKRAPLNGLAAPLKQIEGALTLLGETDAIALVHEAAETVAGFAASEAPPDQEVFAALAHRLSALGFYIDSLQHGGEPLEYFLNPEAARRPAAESEPAEAAPAVAAEVPAKAPESAPARGVEAASEGAAAGAERDTLVEPVFAGQDELAPELTEDTTAEADSFSLEAFEPEPEAGPAPVPEPAPETRKLIEASDEEIDAELLAIFIEEAHEVLATIGEHLELLRTEPANTEYFTAIRRGFHTLKGSGRMVGLRDLGEAAWGLEQTLNRWLQLEWLPTPALHHLVDAAHQLFGQWVAQLEAGGPHGLDATALLAEAERLRSSEDAVTEPAPMAEARVAAPADVDGADELMETSLELPELMMSEGGEVLPFGRDDHEAAFFPEETSLEDLRLLEDSTLEEIALGDELALDDEAAPVKAHDTAEAPAGLPPSGDEVALELVATEEAEEVSPPPQATTTPADADGLDEPAQVLPEVEELLPEDEAVEDIDALDFPIETEAFELDTLELATEDAAASPSEPAPHRPAVSAEQSALGGDTEAGQDLPLPDFDFGDLGELPPAAREGEAAALLPSAAELGEEAEPTWEIEALEAEGLQQALEAGRSEEAESEAPAEPAHADSTEAEPMNRDGASAEAEAPEALDLGSIDLEAAEAEAAEPEAVEPEFAELEAVELEATEPEAVELEAAEPEAAEPEVVELEAVELEPAEPGAAEPELAELEAVDLEAAEPEPIEAEASIEPPAQPAAPAPGTEQGEAVAETPPAAEDTRAEAAIETPATSDADFVRIGDIEISPPLYDLYQAEARHHLATLHAEFNRLQANPTLVPPEPSLRAAHTLAGISGTARLTPIHALARALEHAQERLRDSVQPPTAEQTELFKATADTLEAMLAEISERQMPLAVPELIEPLEAVGRAARTDLEPADDVTAPAPEALVEAAESAESASAPPAPAVHDDLDLQLLPIFLEEGAELLGQLHASLRAWSDDTGNAEHPQAIARQLHTLKGSARMAGAMTLGEHVHQMESRLEAAQRAGVTPSALVEEMTAGLDLTEQMIDVLASGGAEAEPSTAAAAPAADVGVTGAESEAVAGAPTLRVRADAVDRFVNEAGEIGIARTRIEGELRTLRRSLLDLTENVIRLRNQLREVEIQADVQMQSRIAQAESHHAEFDPLEMDRYTRLQELTRMMAESVNDVTTVQQNLLKNLDGADVALHAQARMSRDLQQALMQVRMVPFDSLADRLYRVVRQSAKDLGKRANLDLRGGRIEIDRGLLEHVVAPLEHLLRNAVAHGIEAPEARRAAGKPELGQITLEVRQEGNEVAIELADDGGGLDFARIAERARANGLLGDGEQADERRLTNLIFVPGFSTAGAVSAVSGRGVGMDVVKSETAAVGGRLDVHSTPGSGSVFRIYLPLTLAVTQALLVRAGNRTHAIPSTMIAQVLELKTPELDRLRAEGGTEWQGEHFAYRYLPRLLGDYATVPEVQRFNWVLLLRAGAQTLALHVDALRGNQEIVVKNAGPQIARMVGISGATVLGDGEIVLILNPVALASRGLGAEAGLPADQIPQAAPAVHVPTIMVVDDSLTVRKISSRLLEREGYRVITAKDGVDALEKLLETVPDVILSDIEMPRMDGFDLVRNIRADQRTKDVPVIMITSRLAEKHRRYAEEVGANHYLGKPYQEEELLALLKDYTAT